MPSEYAQGELDKDISMLTLVYNHVLDCDDCIVREHEQQQAS